MLKVRETLLDLTKDVYAKDDLETGDMLDCTFGCNPYGCPQEVTEEAADVDAGSISEYPHSQVAYDALSEYWRDFCFLEKENIVLCEGSISGINMINQVLACKDAKCLGISPQFSDFVVNAEINGIEYTALVLDEKDGYRFDIEKFMPLIKDDITMIYIDNPNNPTGQTISVYDLHRIIRYANEKDIVVVIDEAYGDFIAKHESAVQFLERYRNLIVLRTMSKGFGMAGVRAGYILSDRPLARFFTIINNPYTVGEMSRHMIAAALKHKDKVDEDIEKFIKANKLIEKELAHRVKIAEHDCRIPIFTAYVEDESVDLVEELMDHGVIAVSGASFRDLGKNAARIRLPKEEDTGRLLEALKAIDDAE